MRKFLTKTVAITALSGAIVVGGAGIASADSDTGGPRSESQTEDTGNLSVAGNLSLSELLEGLLNVDASGNIVLGDEVVNGNDVSDNISGNADGNATGARTATMSAAAPASKAT